MDNPHIELYRDATSNVKIEGLTINERAKIAFATASEMAHETASTILANWGNDAEEVTIQRLEMILELTSPDHLRKKIFGRGEE